MASGETEEQLEERHERELEELEEKITAHLDEVKAASKGKKAKAALDAAEREVEQWRYEMTERHREELEGLQDATDGAEEVDKMAKAYDKAEEAERKASLSLTPSQEEAVDEKERAARKKEKALQKRQKKSTKEAEKEAEKEREKLEAGPSGRELEIAALTVSLAKQKPPLTILEVAADGNCMYHAVGDQISRIRPDLHKWKLPPARIYEEVRALCADALRNDADSYAPFAELADGEDYDGYCKRVEKSADWGGELELRALADVLHVKILVHRAEESKPLELGDVKSRGDPLQLTYHRHYYSLGAHYNSAILRD